MKKDATTSSRFCLLLALALSGMAACGTALGGDIPPTAPTPFPMWEQYHPTNPVTVADYRKMVEKAAVGGGAVMLLGPSTNETEITDDIRSLARALGNDPLEMFKFVRNRIRYVPLIGVRNGATATLLAGTGTDLDQCTLLIALLRAANPTTDAHYVEGEVIYQKSYLTNMYGVASSQLVSFMQDRGLPVDTGYGPTVLSTYRYWVKASINGTNYVMDPSFCQYREVTAIDAKTLMGYNRTQFVARALSGATEISNSLRSVNETNITADLTTYSATLLGWIRTNQPNADTLSVFGGREPIPIEFMSLPTELPYAEAIVGSTSYSSLPDFYFLKMRIQHPGIDKTFKGYEIAGKRTTILYTGAGNAPELRVEGVLVSTGSGTTISNKYSMTLTVTQTTIPARTNTQTLVSGGSYLVANDFGSASQSLLAKVNEQLSKDRASGLTNTSEAVLGGSLHVMALSWLYQHELQQRLVGVLQKTLTDIHFRVGVMAQETGYYIDIPMGLFSATHVTGDNLIRQAAWRSRMCMASALEHATLEQLQGTNSPGVSTVKLIGLNNVETQEVYFATNSNWSGAGGVKSKLVNYSASELARIEFAITNQAVAAILPRNGGIGLNQWSGSGYVLYRSDYVGMIINGSLKGGYNSTAGTVSGSVVNNYTFYAESPPLSYHLPLLTSLEPVDLRSGTYRFSHTDLSMGPGEPLGTRFQRQYDGQAHWRDGALRFGWGHNYDIRAVEHSHGEPVLGQRLPLDAVSQVVFTQVAADLMRNEVELRAWVISSLAATWAARQLTENAVTVHSGDRSLEYVRLPDGSFNPPPAMTTKLLKTNGLYRLEERFGTRWDFGANNRISSWQDANGNALSFTYNSQTNVASVTNAFGRGLTFTYTGSTQLNSVADSSGRSVSFGYAAGNLTSFTDPEGQAWSYAYDGEHRITKVTDPLSQVTASNTYDATGMVVTQRNGAGYSWAFFVAAKYRGAEQDPYGARTTYFFDNEGRQTCVEDPLGNRRYSGYDGQGHVTNQIDPQGYQTVYNYDSNHNRTNTVDALGNATAFTYDSQYRLVSVRDPLGHVTQYGYDSEHHITNVVDALGNGTASAYYANGLPQTITGPRGEVTSYTYDSYGNPATIVRMDGGTETRTWNVRGDLLTLTDANTNTTTYTYDKRRLLTSGRDPYGRAVSNVYNTAGLLVTTVDKQGLSTTRTWTPTYKEKSVQFPDGGAVTNFYDAAGNRTAYVNPKSARMGFGFDKMSRRVTDTNALGQVTRYVFDSAGNLRQRVNANGQTTYFYYNAVNLLTNRQSAVENVSFSYDPNGNLTNMVDALGTTRQSFDSMNRLTKVVDPFGQTVSNQYNLAGWRTQITYPDGKTEQFAYNPSGQITNAVASGFGTANYQYDSRGNLTGATLPGGLSTSYAYDNVNRLSSWSISKAGSNLLARSCTRNGLGFKETESIAAGLETLDGPGSQSRTHNAADQITSVQQGGPASTNLPAFDLAGNTTQVVLSVKGQTFKTLYRYDFDNKLLGVSRLRNNPQGQSVTTSVTQLEYNGQGLLLRITDNGTVRRLVRDRIDALARPLVETDASGNAVYWFVWGYGRLLAQIGTGSVIRIAHCDELGRVLAFTDSGGNLTDELSYSPYGRLIAHSGTTATPMTWLGAFGVWDAGHGLYLTRHRAYDANLCRFTSPDPLGLDASYNLYVYCDGNVLFLVDPLGLYSYDTENMGVAFIHEVNPFNADGSFWRGSAAFVDGVVPFVDPLAYAGAYNANDPAFQASQAVGGVTRDVIAVIGGGGIGTVARAEGVAMSAGQRFVLGEFGPSLGSLITSAEPLSQASLWAGYALKWGGRVDSYIKIKNALDGNDSYEQPCPPK